jgi:hypothetical protein
MVIAAIAWKHLTPAAQAEASRLVGIGATPRTNDFISAACWADDVRRDRRETGPWHYIDIYFRNDGKPPQNKPDAENAVWAIDRFSAILKDKSKPDAERAEALRFLIHIVGDIHQPLHATSKESDERPKGDAGGNAFRIEPPSELAHGDRPPRNLHALWDLGVGLFPSTTPGFRPLNDERRQEIETIADKVQSEYPLGSQRAVHDLKPMDWANESYHTAVSVVYNLSEDSQPGLAYVAEGQRVSAQRAALAGYRLAELLNRLLK